MLFCVLQEADAKMGLNVQPEGDSFEKKWKGKVRSLGEPADCNVSLTLNEGDRGGKLMGVP